MQAKTVGAPDALQSSMHPYEPATWRRVATEARTHHCADPKNTPVGRQLSNDRVKPQGKVCPEKNVVLEDQNGLKVRCMRNVSEDIELRGEERYLA